MKKILAFSSGIAFYIILAILLSGYSNDPMHMFINGRIFDQFSSELGNYPEFSNYSIDENVQVEGLAVTNKGFFGATFEETDESMSLRDWVIHGGMSGDEPEAIMSVRHFYDPLGIDEGQSYLTDFPSGTSSANPEIHILEWALEYNGEINKGLSGNLGWSQRFSWKDGTESLTLAMNTLDKQEQERLFSHAWRSLGECLHALGDMVCPVHVRNDGHPLGDGDPFEDGIIKDNLIPSNPSQFWDQNLINSLKSKGSIRQLYHELADYTNKNFYTNQTIWGRSGIGQVKPVIRPNNPYPYPYLQENNAGWRYDANTYTFYRDYRGVETKMCKDRYYFEYGIPGFFRTLDAYVDLDVAKSQAQPLLSNLMGIGPEVIKRFLPVIKIEITEAGINDGLIKGKVEIKSTVEYPMPGQYNSWIQIENITTNRTTEIPVFQGQFTESQLSFKKGDKLEASIHLGGVIIKSDPFVVEDDFYRNYVDKGNDISISCLFPNVVMQDNKEYEVRFGSSVNDNDQYDQVSYQLVGQRLLITKSYDRTSSNNRYTKDEQITLEFSNDFSRINNLKFNYSKEDKVGFRTNTYDVELEIDDIDIYVTGGNAGEPDSYLSFIVETKDNFEDKLVKFNYNYHWYDQYSQTGGDLRSVSIKWSDPDVTFPEYCLIYIKKI